MKVVRCALLLIILCGVGATLLYFAFAERDIDFEPQAFDSKVWRMSEPTMSWQSVRLKMVDDLVAKKIRIGMSRSEVEALLGKPDDTLYFKDYDMVYYLGRERRFIAIDSEWLVFKTTDDKVVIYALMSD